MRPQHEQTPAPSLNDARVPARRGPRARSGLTRLGVVGALSAAVLLSGTVATPTLTAAPSGGAPVVSAEAAPSTAVAASKKLAQKKLAKKRALKKAKRARYEVKMKRLAKKKPRTAAKKMMKIRKYSKSQRMCVIKLWDKESNWRWWADNPSSSAYGIPQALPGRKMASAGADWKTNPVTQIRWGLKYIKDRHGSPCGAWSHSKQRGWY